MPCRKEGVLFDLVSFEADVRCGWCLFTGALLLLVFSVMEGDFCWSGCLVV